MLQIGIIGIVEIIIVINNKQPATTYVLNIYML